MTLNPGWIGDPPLRTGVPTLRNLLQVVVRLLVAFSPIIKEHIEPELHPLLDNLLDAANEFLDNIPSPRP